MLLNSTRIGSEKPPPKIVTVSPPCGLPVFGLTEERRKKVEVFGSRILIFTKATTPEF
ncbi:MAG: hypothetical protein R2862_00255 [Thermoanaerobaculia bacterium]